MLIGIPDASTNWVSGTAVRGPQGCPSGQEAADGGAVGAGHVAMHSDAVADRLDRDRRVVVDHEPAADQCHSCGAGMEDVVAAVGQRAVIARADDQVAATFSPIGAGQADVGDPSEPHVIDRAEESRWGAECWQVDHHRPVRQVDEPPEVDGVAVGGEEQRRRVHQLGEQQERVVLDPLRQVATTNCCERGTAQRTEERLHAVHEVEMVVQQRRRRLRRSAVVELQRSEPALDACRASRTS